MNKRKQLIDMISRKEEQRYWYKTTFIFMPRGEHYPRTWEEYDQISVHLIGGDDDDGDKLFLTPEQASQLGDVRDYNILLQSGYHDKLVEWGLRERAW